MIYVIINILLLFNEHDFMDISAKSSSHYRSSHMYYEYLIHRAFLNQLLLMILFRIHFDTHS